MHLTYLALGQITTNVMAMENLDDCDNPSSDQQLGVGAMLKTHTYLHNSNLEKP